MKPILRLVRFPNLVIVVLTQYLLQYAILKPAIHPLGMMPVLPHFEFFLLVLSTVLIAAGGYVINDIEDIEIDKLNKPEKKRIVGRVYSLKTSWLIYWFCTILGFLISLYLAFYVKNIVQLMIYPVAVGLLFAYSRWFKKQVLIGNLVVSFFCAFVAWVVFYAQNLSSIFTIFLKTHWLDSVRLTFMGYAAFAFFSTLFREIVKDIEDAEGDRAGECSLQIFSIQRAAELGELERPSLEDRVECRAGIGRLHQVQRAAREITPNGLEAVGDRRPVDAGPSVRHLMAEFRAKVRGARNRARDILVRHRSEHAARRDGDAQLPRCRIRPHHRPPVRVLQCESPCRIPHGA